MERRSKLTIGQHSQRQAAPTGRAAAVVEICPHCGRRGRPVDTRTIKALLNVTLEVLHPVTYRFCATPDCPNVYFAEDGSHVLGEDQLRVRVHQKHPHDADVLVCYCFFHSPGSVRAEIAAHGATDVVERVTALTKVDACACDIRNPQGSCCLGNLQRVVKDVKSAEIQQAN
ncbi:MAG: hypothetical protein KatS3mg053_3995 [Candidatus Roseilinea sp.]|nr:MAG: hypothetical protein KatS3mg053_3995 [Candidatus Roseilinea sp.]